MKLISLIIVLIISFAASSQGQIKQKKQGGAAEVHAYAGGERDTCLNREFSIVIYAMQDSLQQRTIASHSANISSLISSLNKAFAPIGVSFKACSTVMIPHYIFNYWRFGKTDQFAVQNWYTKGAINLYMPDEMHNWPGLDIDAYAFSYGVQGAVQNTLDVVVVATVPGKFQNESGLSFSNAVHAFGHYFGLPDTYAGLGPPASPPPPSLAISSHEFTDGSNSAVNGDLFTDTEADCFPVEWYTPPYVKPVHCGYGFEAKDGKGKYYTPPVDNFMSQWTCRCRFTQQQYNHMARFILKNRLHVH